MEILTFLAGVFVGCLIGCAAMFWLLLYGGQALDEEMR